MERKEEWVNTNNSVELTVLTPTYNRAELLKRCYESLYVQDNKKFIWMIVDDGSTDNTEYVIKRFINDGALDIVYYHKNNGGKHTAVNYGVKKVTTDLVLILDSDDRLTEDAVSSVLDIYHENKNEKGICGFTFLKEYSDGRTMGDVFPSNGRYNFIKWRVNGIVSGDQSDIFYTKIMQNYPFSEYEGERFIGESTSWIKMASKYDMICKNKSIYIADYLDGGLTKEGRKMRLKYPKGGMEYANACMSKGVSFRRKVKSAVLYVCYGKESKTDISSLISRSNAKIITCLMLPFGVVLNKIWSHRYKNR